MISIITPPVTTEYSSSFSHGVKSGTGIGSVYTWNHNKNKPLINMWMEQLSSGSWHEVPDEFFVGSSTRIFWRWYISSAYARDDLNTVQVSFARIGSQTETIRFAGVA